jgi:hypothetical protein
MVAQMTLGSYGLNSGDIDIEKIPEPLREEYRRKLACAIGGKLKLALQDAYRLLEKMRDPVGIAFDSRYGADARGPLAGLLSARNHSLLAHGITPIAENRAKALREEVATLARLACGNTLDQHLADAQPVRIAIP